jgi:hypothetical protein
MRCLFLSPPVRGWVLGALGALVLVVGLATPSRAVLTDTIEAGSSMLTSINTLDPIGPVLETPVAATASRDGAGLLTKVAFASDVFETIGYVAPVTDPAALPIVGLIATFANNVPDFVRGFKEPGKIGGLMPIDGINKVCLFGSACGAGVNLAVPISVVGGATGGAATVSVAINVTVIGAPWTQGTASIGTVTRMGNAASTMMTTPTQMTAAASEFTNNIQLVTPIFVSTNIPASAVVPAFGVLSLTIKSPEPGVIAGIGAAFIALVAVGMARRR